jgi:hypothetical protein
MVALKTLVFSILDSHCDYSLAHATRNGKSYPSHPHSLDGWPALTCVGSGALCLVCGSMHRSLGRGTHAPIDAPRVLEPLLRGSPLFGCVHHARSA